MTVDRPRIPGWAGLRTAREIAAAGGARTAGNQLRAYRDVVVGGRMALGTATE